MAERLPEPAPPRTTYPPVEPTADVARRNILLGLGLLGLALLIAAGAVVVALIYLHYD
jgi:hypothetical protein